MSYEEEKQDRKIEQLGAEIERLRAENRSISKAVIDVSQERDLAQAEFRAYHKAWEEQATRIQEREGALVEVRANANRSGTGYILMSYLRDNNIDTDKYFSDKAKEQLRAEGKIGPDAKPRSWQITEDRVTAIDQGLRFLEWSNAKTGNVETKKRIAILKTMLEETGDKNGFEGRNKMRIETIR